MSPNSTSAEYSALKHYLKITNWFFLVIEFLFMLAFLTITLAYARHYSTFKDPLTLLTLVTLILSLIFDSLVLPDAFPWADIDQSEILIFIAMQMSKVCFLVAVVLYAAKWMVVIMKAGTVSLMQAGPVTQSMVERARVSEQ